MKRTRPIRGKYFLTMPRITHEGRILEIKVKISQVIITDMGRAKRRPGKEEGMFPHEAENLAKQLGEIERGRVDGEE